VKVLDFGLAKALDPTSDAGSPGTSAAPLGAHATQVGIIVGTPAYMSPEQVHGRTVDRRADIWAFGVVFYEMLTGTRPHTGDSGPEIMASVLDDQPKWERIPSQAVRLLKRCLEKDPHKRLRHIGDVMSLLEETPSGPLATAAAAPASRARTWLAPAVAALVAGFAVAAVSVWAPRRPATSAGHAVRFEVGPTDEMAYLGPAMSVSPDGRWITFAAQDRDGVTRSWLRSLETVETRALPGTETTAEAPVAAWSWDSRSLIFATGAKLKKIDIQGGPPQTLADVQGYINGAACNRDGVIVVGTFLAGPLLRLVASRGVMAQATVLAKGETNHRWPQFLPDGRHFLYLRVSSDPGQMGVYIGSIDARPEEQSRKRLVATNRQAYYAASPDGEAGHLVFMRETTLMAQPFDPARMELSGEPVAIAEGVDSNVESAEAMFSVSQTGTLVYLAGRASRMVLTWFDRLGHRGATLGEPGEYSQPAVSPDGTRVAVALGPATRRDIWILDVARGTATRFTFDPAWDDDPVWSPDGKQIAFTSERAGRWDLFIKPADGSGEERLLLTSEEIKDPNSWSRDGRHLVFTSYRATGGASLWALPMQGEPKPIAIHRASFRELMGVVSPDTRWLAYISRESGMNEIYVRPFSPGAAAAATEAHWRISKATGFHPRWRADGKELFYSSHNLEEMAVDIDTSKGFRAGPPRLLFAAPPPLLDVGWDAAPDGKRFLFVAQPGGKSTVPFTVVLNWAAGLRN
jgi:Tol biopolymer transport system component